MTKKLYCFPDTNLFIQCKPINEWDWALFGDFDAIDVIITRPVQKEIDAHKGKGNTRIASRARSTATLLNQAIESALDYKEVRASNPCVRLYVSLELKQDTALASVLNYQEVDDQLVGIVAGFRSNNPNANVVLATLDIGPKASAKTTGVPFVTIPDSWLLPPEEDKAAKELKRLTQELERIKKTEPSFVLNWSDGKTPVEEINTILYCYKPLEPYQVATFMQAIKQRHLMATDFGSSEIKERQPESYGVMGDVSSLHRTLLSLNPLAKHDIYLPASPKAIAQYKQAYEQWLLDCNNMLENLHTHLSASIVCPRLSVELNNTGTRSAEKALVTLAAKGDFCIFPIKKDEMSNDTSLALKRPPQAPQGSWQNKFASSLGFGHSAVLSQINGISILNDKQLNAALGGLNRAHKREEDAFYYKPSRPLEPVSQYALECALWRHQSDTEVFDLTLHAELKPSQISGVVEVTIQASNVSDVFTQRLPIHIEVQPASTLERADQLVNDLLSYRVYRYKH